MLKWFLLSAAITGALIWLAVAFWEQVVMAVMIATIVAMAAVVVLCGAFALRALFCKKGE